MTKLYKIKDEVEKLGRTMTQERIAIFLGVSVRTVRAAIRRMEIPYLEKKRGRKKKARGHQRGSTFELFLGKIGIDTESGIAREAGVSRQRIHQLERELCVCRLMKEGKRKKL